MFFRDKDDNSYMEEVGFGKKGKEEKEKEIKKIVNEQKNKVTFKIPTYYLMIAPVKKWMKDKYDKLFAKSIKVYCYSNHPELDIKLKQHAISKCHWYEGKPVYHYTICSDGELGEKVEDLPEDLKINCIVEYNGFVFDSHEVLSVKSIDIYKELGSEDIALPQKANKIIKSYDTQICLTKLGDVSSYYL